MGSLTKNAVAGSTALHRIREFELEKVNLAEEFDILQIVGEGWFGKILLVEHKATDTEMVLKALPKPYTPLKDFYREFHYGLNLGVHKHIITTYDVAFETAGFYVFSQEYAPLGDLTSNVSDTGIGELYTKKVAKQLSSALEHLHNRDLVHRDIKLDNILVFKSDFSRIKLCDFGETRRVGSIVLRRNEWLPYAPPEVLQIPTDGSYLTNTSHDVWQFAVVLFVCLTGCLPWQKAAVDDPRYTRYYSWHTSSLPIKRIPKLFKLITSKAQKLFRKYLEPKPDRRPTALAELHRYLEDRWLSRGGLEKVNESCYEDEGLCPSMYSFHSSPEEKNKLLKSLTEYGLEATVDRKSKKDRIRQWIQATVIEEETEADLEEDLQDLEDLGIKDIHTGPLGERFSSRGPVGKENVTAKENGNNGISKSRKMSTFSLKNETAYVPPIDPRIPLEQQKVTQNHQKNDVNNSAPELTTEIQSKQNIPRSPVSARRKSSSPALPNSRDNPESGFVHKINVQLPQANYMAPMTETYPTPKHHQSNGRSSSREPINGKNNNFESVQKLNTLSHKIFSAYNTFENKSSSSNSDTEKLQNKMSV